jgi:RNA polymerase sigma factor (sigma-70 family)
MDRETVGAERVEAAPVHAFALADDALVDAWQAHRDEIYAFLVRTTRDEEVAQDLLQEAYLRLMRELRAGRGPDNVRAWLYRAAGNLAISRGRRLASAIRALVRIKASVREDATAGEPEDTYLRSERRSSILARLATLDPDARAALLMASEGFSGAEIAAAIGRSELATRALLCRTRVRLRGDLDTMEAAR